MKLSSKFYLHDSEARRTHSPDSVFYVGMIGGQIVEIDRDQKKAKFFNTAQEALNEKSTYAPFLRGFEVRSVLTKS